ncbi:hypothetical protein BF93_13655 [Brachybacterium phenoliresistens]|uniref:Uncharacterized protein n=1 Tax=Brachybacterium phenoliresistens TaxID=396014 RepID=Z9JW96_9MICO|nr:hypothetical protein [Brachybacterium phenoliresistens]EWS82056.1 hypothetical protein BF93_13655 [Brachybacterium phenoliresistens]
MRSLVEGVAQAIADLRIVDPSQWALRLGALAALLLAAALVTGMAPFGSPQAVLLTLVVLLLGLLQTARPDADAGLVAFCVLVIAVVIAGPLGAGATLALAALLMVSHALWALAASVPAHGVVRRGALAATVRRALPALGIGLVAGAGLLALAGAGAAVPAWLMIPGVVAVVVLLVLLLPRDGAPPAPRDPTAPRDPAA